MDLDVFNSVAKINKKLLLSAKKILGKQLLQMERGLLVSKLLPQNTRMESKISEVFVHSWTNLIVVKQSVLKANLWT